MNHPTECDLRLRPTLSANIPHSPTFARVFRECAQDAARAFVAAPNLFAKAEIARLVQRSGRRFALLTKQYIREIQLSMAFAEVWKS